MVELTQIILKANIPTPQSPAKDIGRYNSSQEKYLERFFGTLQDKHSSLAQDKDKDPLLFSFLFWFNHIEVLIFWLPFLFTTVRHG